MLGKLFKYEFKNTSKIMLTIYIVLIAVTALGMGIMSVGSFRESSNPVVGVLTGLYLLVYVFSIFALLVVTFVYLSIHFYKTMYSAQGYLTHTLPVKPISSLHVKLIASLVWMLLSILLLFLSVLGLINAASGFEFWQELKALDLSEYNSMIMYNFGVSMGELLAVAIVGVISSCLIFLLMIYLSCSIGQLFNQHKVAASIIAGIVLYFIQQVVPSVIAMIQMVSSNIFSANASEIDTSFANFYRVSLWTGLIINLVFIAIYYIACRIILKKHINLE